MSTASMNRPTEQSHEEHVEAGRRGGRSRGGSGGNKSNSGDSEETGKMHRPTEQTHEEHVEAGRKGGRARSKASGKSDDVQTDSPAKKARTINQSKTDASDFDPDMDKEMNQTADGKDPVRVEAGKKAAETRARNQAKKKSGRARGAQSKNQDDGDDNQEGGAEEEDDDEMEELSKDPEISKLKEKQNAEREMEIQEATTLLSNSLKMSPRADLASLMDPSGKNLIQVIRAEHRMVEQAGDMLKMLLQKDDEVSTKAAEGIAFNIMKLLSIHAACEEMVLYPFLKSKGHEQLVMHALEEHTQMKKDLLELDGMKPTDAGFMDRLEKCLEDTLHHVTEEEEGLLPLVESLCDEGEMSQMLQQFLDGHTKSPTRPHLEAPTEPPANLKANADIAKEDMQMDVDEGRFEKVEM